MAVQTALISPPVALSLYIVASIVKAPMKDANRAIWPFMVVVIGITIAMALFPRCRCGSRNDSDSRGEKMEKVRHRHRSGRGIARRVALDFAAQGSRVAVVDLVAERAKNTTKEIERAGGTALSLVCDVRSEASVRDQVKQNGAHVGAGGRAGQPAGGYTLAGDARAVRADWDMVMDPTSRARSSARSSCCRT